MCGYRIFYKYYDHLLIKDNKHAVKRIFSLKTGKYVKLIINSTSVNPANNRQFLNVNVALYTSLLHSIKSFNFVNILLQIPVNESANCRLSNLKYKIEMGSKYFNIKFSAFQIFSIQMGLNGQIAFNGYLLRIVIIYKRKI